MAKIENGIVQSEFKNLLNVSKEMFIENMLLQ